MYAGLFGSDEYLMSVRENALLRASEAKTPQEKQEAWQDYNHALLAWHRKDGRTPWPCSICRKRPADTAKIIGATIPESTIACFACLKAWDEHCNTYEKKAKAYGLHGMPLLSLYSFSQERRA